MASVKGQNVLITGAGRGLGRELALALSAAGAAVAVSDCVPNLAEELAAEIYARGTRAVALPLDVTDDEVVLAARQRLAAEFGPIDILVNNAGIVHGGPFLDVSLAQHRQTIAVNLGGLVAVTHAFLPDLIQRPRATVVNIASASALVALPGATTYAASKAAVLSFSDSLREELRQTGNGHVQILAVCPSFIDTGMFAGAKPPIGSRMLSAQEVAKRIVSAIERDQEMLILPRSTAWMWSLFRGLPRSLFRRICRKLGVSASMKDWKGRR